jgi:hypothetical protein
MGSLKMYREKSTTVSVSAQVRCTSMTFGFSSNIFHLSLLELKHFLLLDKGEGTRLLVEF